MLFHDVCVLEGMFHVDVYVLEGMFHVDVYVLEGMCFTSPDKSSFGS